MNIKPIQFKEQIKNRRKKDKPIKNNYQVTTERQINPSLRENTDNMQNNRNRFRKILIPIIIMSVIVVIIAAILVTVYFFNKKKIIKISPSDIDYIKEDIDYTKAESLIGLESIKSNYLLLNETLNNIIDSLMAYENIDLKPINTEINYECPNFLENPTKIALKIVKSDFEFYKTKYEKLSEISNNLTEIAKQSYNNIYTSLNITKNEVKNLLSQFEEIIRNLSIPFLLKEKYFSDKTNLRNLNKDENNDENKRQILNQLKEYKKGIDRLNILYNEYFNYIN